jgi:hypothetical protein
VFQKRAAHLEGRGLKLQNVLSPDLSFLGFALRTARGLEVADSILSFLFLIPNPLFRREIRSVTHLIPALATTLPRIVSSHSAASDRLSFVGHSSNPLTWNMMRMFRRLGLNKTR